MEAVILAFCAGFAAGGVVVYEWTMRQVEKWVAHKVRQGDL